MYKYIIFIVFIGCLICIGLSCNNCNPATQLLLTEQQKKQNPFKGFEKIIFNTGDSLIEFTGTGRKNRIMEYEFDASGCERGFVEYDELTFTSKFHEINLQMYGRNNFHFYFYDSLNHIFLYSWFFVESNPNNNSEYNEFIDTLKIGDYQFHDIYKDTLYNNSLTFPFPISLKHAIYLYYSNENGIVKFDFSDGSTWELKEIVWK